MLKQKNVWVSCMILVVASYCNKNPLSVSRGFAIYEKKEKMFHTHRKFLCDCFQHKGIIHSCQCQDTNIFITASLCRNSSDNEQTLSLAGEGGGEPRRRCWLLQRKPFESQQSGFWGRSTAPSVANDWPDSCSQERGHGHQTHTNSLNRPFSLGVLCHWCKNQQCVVETDGVMSVNT